MDIMFLVGHASATGRTTIHDVTPEMKWSIHTIKAFFFLDYEGLRYILATSSQVSKDTYSVRPLGSANTGPSSSVASTRKCGGIGTWT